MSSPSHNRVMLGKYGIVSIPLIPDEIDTMFYDVQIPKSAIPHVIAALQVLTSPSIYQSDDSVEIARSIDVVHTIINTLKEYEVPMDCNGVDDCLETSENFINLIDIATNAELVANEAKGSAQVARYNAAGKVMATYNPAVPLKFNSMSPDANKIWCIISMWFIDEYCRKIINLTSLLLNLATVVNIGVTIIGAIPKPAWLQAIVNYIVIPMTTLGSAQASALRTAASDQNARNNLYCQLNMLFANTSVSESAYYACIDAINTNSDDTNIQILTSYAKSHLRTVEAYLYLCDLIALAQGQDLSEYNCGCVQPTIQTYNFTGTGLPFVPVENAYWINNRFGTPSSTPIGFKIRYNIPTPLKMRKLQVTTNAQYTCSGNTLKIYLYTYDGVVYNLVEEQSKTVTSTSTINEFFMIEDDVRRIEIELLNGCGAGNQNSRNMDDVVLILEA